MSGFVAAKGTDWTTGDTAEIAKRLGQLGKALNVEFIGISGYRTPSRSVAVGGYADDPHTKGEAGDIGVNSATRASAAQITDAQLASVGLYRPFPGADEINHVQLMPAVKQQLKAATVTPSPTVGSGNNDLSTGDSGKSDSGGGIDLNPAHLAQNAAQSVLDATLGKAWNGIKSHAEYAGLFTVLVLAGVALVIVGLARASGADEKARDLAGKAKTAAEVAAL